MKRRLFAVVAVLLVAASPLSNAWAQASWIDTTAATKVARSADVVVLDARAPKDYADGHVYGALSAPWQSFSDMAGKPGNAHWGTLLPADKLGAAIGALGIGKATRVLVYASSPKGWGEDGRVAWTLRSAGVSKVAMVDGGYEGWVAAGAKVSQTVTKRPATTFTVTAVNNTLNVTKEEVKSALGHAKIIDARAAEEYAGAQKFGEPRGGHLPGAVNLPWDKVFDANGHLQDAGALKKIAADAGLKTDDEIITYCTKGIRSAHLALVLREIGYSKARNYDASFYEWAGDEALPLVK
jgi:thiosulfate/3-mercaptopyruvate sulfurtransferase